MFVDFNQSTAQAVDSLVSHSPAFWAHFPRADNYRLNCNGVACTIRLYRGKQPVHTYNPHRFEVWSVAKSPDRTDDWQRGLVNVGSLTISVDYRGGGAFSTAP
jgi:hypothetical protein